MRRRSVALTKPSKSGPTRVSMIPISWAVQSRDGKTRVKPLSKNKEPISQPIQQPEQTNNSSSIDYVGRIRSALHVW